MTLNSTKFIEELTACIISGYLLPRSLQTTSKLDAANGIISVEAICPHCETAHQVEVLFDRSTWPSWASDLLPLSCCTCQGRFVALGNDIGNAVFNDAAMVVYKKHYQDFITKNKPIQDFIEYYVEERNKIHMR